jgi:PAS domain S-box-containing protein
MREIRLLLTRRYGTAVLAVLLAVLLTLPLQKRAERLDFPLLLAAVMVSAWYGGLGPGLVATVLAVAASSFFLLAPIYSFQITDPNDTIHLGVFILVALLISSLNERLRAALRRAEEATRALRESEALYRTLGEAAPDLVWSCSPDGQVDYVNQRWREYTGMSLEQINASSWKSLCHPDDLPRMQGAWATAVGRGEPFESEFRYWRHDGVYRWFMGRAIPLKDEAGAVIKWVGTSTDIEDRKRAEDEVRQRAAALVEADRRKDEFLAVLSHELRNPLAPIRNAVQLLKQLGPPEPRLVRTREIIERQVRHMARLLDDLLDVSRITNNKMVLHSDKVNLGLLVHDTVEDCRSVIEGAGLTLSVESLEGPLWVEGDATRLAQVLGNLLHNAAKFTVAGGRVTVRLAAEGERARITVSDNGLGITPEVLPYVFDTFTQAERSLARTRGGLGLGLALVKGFVELHGGEVWARSQGAGCGTQFTILLPTTPAPAASERIPTTGSLPVGPLRILVVEDNRDAAETLRELLELSGCTVAVAHSGTSALQAARQFRPEVVLCDLGLPGMDGYQVAEQLRQDPTTARARLIAVSGYGQEEDQRRSREAGFDLHLTKPVEFAQIERLLEVTPEARRA